MVDLEELIVNSLTEFINSKISGLSCHKVELKIKSIIILLNNFNSTQGLNNGTRMQITALTIQCSSLR